MTLNLAIGQITPPVAVNLYVIANITNISLETISRSIIPFILIMVCALILVIFFPPLALYFPSLFGLK